MSLDILWKIPTLEKNFVKTFSFNINLPNTSIDCASIESLDERIFVKYLREKNVMINYVCTREDGKHPPKSSHYHLWCVADTCIRRDRFRDDYVKPYIEYLGFNEHVCTGFKNGRQQYLATKVNKVLTKEHDVRFSLGYLFKGEDKEEKKPFHMKMNCLSRCGITMKDIEDCLAYYKQTRPQFIKRKSKHSISECMTDRFLEQHMGDELWAEKVIDAHRKGYKMKILKASVWCKAPDCLSQKDLLYIWKKFNPNKLPHDLSMYDEYLQSKLIEKESFKRRRFN